MAERKIEGLDHKELAKNLASQDSQVVPQDINHENKRLVADIVNKLCF